MNKRYFGVVLAVLMLVLYSGCSREKIYKESKTPTEANESTDQNRCAVYFHFIYPQESEQERFDSVYVVALNSNITVHRLSGDFVKLSKNKYIKVTKKNDIGDVADGVKFIAQSLWSDETAIVFKQPDVILNAKDDREKDRILRNTYPEIPAELYPLPGEKNYIESATEFTVETKIVAFYKNVLYFYDAFELNNLELSCYGVAMMFKEKGCITDLPCVAHLRAVVIELDGDGKLKTTLHTSRKPEYFDGEFFRPLFDSNVDESLLKQYDLVKSSYYPLFKNEERTFAFYPYPTNSDRWYKEKMVYGSTLFATRPISIGNEEASCLNYGASGLSSLSPSYDLDVTDYLEQSIILNILDEKLPPAVSTIKDEISKAPNGCGYIDWEKEEIVFGDVRYKADWLPYVNGIYWFDSDEEFPLELFAPKKSPLSADSGK